MASTYDERGGFFFVIFIFVFDIFDLAHVLPFLWVSGIGSRVISGRKFCMFMSKVQERNR